jgi:hypothetical protein
MSNPASDPDQPDLLIVGAGSAGTTPAAPG